MPVATIKKLFITSETDLLDLDRMIRTQFANQTEYSITLLESVHATNFNYYCYVIFLDIDSVEKNIRLIENKIRNIPTAYWNISSWHWEKE